MRNASGTGVAARRVVTLNEEPRIGQFYGQHQAAGFAPFAAIDLRRSSSLPTIFDGIRFDALYGRPPKSGEVGCTLSHLAVIREFAEGQGGDSDWLIIAEDDCVFSPHWQSGVARVIAAANTADVIILGSVWAPPDGDIFDWAAKWAVMSPFSRVLWPRRSGEPRRVVGFISSHFQPGTVLYALTRRAAGVISAGTKDGVYWVADQFSVYEEMGLRIFQVRPALGGQRFDAISSISGGINDSQSFYVPANWRGRLRLRSRLTRLPLAARVGWRDLTSRLGIAASRNV